MLSVVDVRNKSYHFNSFKRVGKEIVPARQDNEIKYGNWVLLGKPPAGGHPALVQNKGFVTKDDFSNLADGTHPATNKKLWSNRLSAGKNRPGSYAFEIQTAPDKSVSALLGILGVKHLPSITRAAKTAGEKTIRDAFQLGLFEAKRGYDVDGKRVYEAVAHCAVAHFLHIQSDADDPHLHSHFVIFRTCILADGSVGRIDKTSLHRYAKPLDKLFMCTLASELAKLGIRIDRTKNGFRVHGIPEKLAKLWSKRRAQITRTLEKNGLTSAQSHKAARLAALKSRNGQKSKLDSVKLMAHWDQEVAAAGFDKMSIGNAVLAGGTSEAKRVRKLQEEDDGTLAVNVLDRIFADKTLTALPDLIAELAHEHIGVLDGNAVLQRINKLITERVIIEGGRNDAGDPVYSTPDAAACEALIPVYLSEVRSRRNLLDTSQAEIFRTTVERLTAGERHDSRLRHETLSACETILAKEAVCIVERHDDKFGERISSIILSALNATGVPICKIDAPSTAGRHVEMKYADSRVDTVTVKEFLAFASEDLNSMLSGTFIVLDKADGVAPQELLQLVKLTAKQNIKLVLLGSTQLCRSRRRASNLKLFKELASNTLRTRIRNQRNPWMQSSSLKMIMSEFGEALRAFDQNHLIRWFDNSRDTNTALCNTYEQTLSRGDNRTLLVLTPDTKKSKRLNQKLRTMHKLHDLVSGEEIEIWATPPGGSKATLLSLAEGDRIIFGQSFNHASDDFIEYMDVATILSVAEQEDGYELHVLLDHGNEVSVKLPRIRLDRGKTPKAHQAPKIGYAYSMDPFMSQHANVDDCFVLIDKTGAYGADSIFIATTRAKENCRFFVNMTGLVNSPAVPKCTAEGEIVDFLDPMNEAIRAGGTVHASLHDLKEEFFGRMHRTDFKVTAADYFDVGQIQEYRGISPFVRRESLERRDIHLKYPSATDRMLANAGIPKALVHEPQNLNIVIDAVLEDTEASEIADWIEQDCAATAVSSPSQPAEEELGRSVSCFPAAPSEQTRTRRKRKVEEQEEADEYSYQPTGWR